MAFGYSDVSIVLGSRMRRGIQIRQAGEMASYWAFTMEPSAFGHNQFTNILITSGMISVICIVDAPRQGGSLT